MAARLRQRQRLKTRADFDRVFRRGRRLEGRMFTLVVAPGATEQDRLGLAVSRRAGGAVVRNRMRRVLREVFRLVEHGESDPLDIVVLAKPELAPCRLAEVQREWLDRLRRARRAGKGRAAPPAAR
jgi:ribonuclease P protein component